MYVELYELFLFSNLDFMLVRVYRISTRQMKHLWKNLTWNEPINKTCGGAKTGKIVVYKVF